MPTLDWIGKKAVVNHHEQVPYRLLKCDPALSAGDPEAENLLVQGDNLLALKALLPYYAGQIKCIYIDPPYNTGNEGWVYNDNVNSPEIKAWLNKTVGSEDEDLSRHDKWLCMMYPRLVLLRKFLREDGAIFISIDDNEQDNLKLLMNEIFGQRNFIAQICWQKKFSPQNDATYFSDMHDFILVYAKKTKSTKNDIVGFKMFGLDRTEEMDDRYTNLDNDPRGIWTSSDLTVKTYSADYDYPITTPSGRVVNPPNGRCWFTSKERMLALISDGRVWFGKNGKNVPRLKRFLSDVKDEVTPTTWWPHQDVGHNQQAKQELKDILQDIEAPFQTPKPLLLLKRILKLSTTSNDLILDSFAGSGTTGHAILKLNKEDGGNRRFILVEMEETVAQTVTAERLKRVIKGYGEQKALDGGFRFCKLGEPLFDEYGNIKDSVRFNDLAQHVYFSETGMPLPKNGKKGTPLIGIHNDAAYYLLFNGIMGDKSISGGNILTSKILELLPKHKGQKIIYGEGCRLGKERLRREKILFKQLPYELKVS
jgi:site-specific DNA-methyltransferase (adenine-specific)/adenine-specific DNA-methyltransferase